MGPTASGKSAYALSLAQKLGGVIINADAMQVYAELRIITARPTQAEMQGVLHVLYGTIPAAERCHAVRWASEAAQHISDAWAQGAVPILVGGTGMYVGTLMQGLSPVPDIPDEVRARVWQLWDELPRGAFHQLLGEKDPETASRLKAGDKQRLMRAMEVWEATGKSLSEWQRMPATPFFPDAHYDLSYLEISRDILYPRINARFESMMKEGALDEVRDFMKLGLPVNLPAMRAHGVPELIKHLKGEMELTDAVAKAQQNTRNYAKRQQTWLRHQLPQAKAIVV